MADFPPIDGAAWERATSGREMKEVTLLRIDSEAHHEVRLGRIAAAPVDRNEEDRLVVAANTLKPLRGPFDRKTLVERLHAALPAIPFTGAMQLESYDSYYYGRGVDRPHYIGANLLGPHGPPATRSSRSRPRVVAVGDGAAQPAHRRSFASH